MFGAIKVIFEIFGIIAYVCMWLFLCKSINDEDDQIIYAGFAIAHCIAISILFIYIWIET